MPNNVDIDSVAGHFAQLLNISWGFCVDMLPYWRGTYRGVVKAHVAAGTVFELSAVRFLLIQLDIYPSFQAKIQQLLVT